MDVAKHEVNYGCCKLRIGTAGVQFIPLRQWVIEERALGQTTPQAIASLTAAMKDPRARTGKHGGLTVQVNF